MNKNIYYLGLFSAKYGYGEAARGYKAIIEDQGWPIKCFDMNTLAAWKELDETDLSSKTLLLHKRPTNDLRSRELSILKRAKRVVYMTVWECDRIPTNWQPFLEPIDHIVVPSVYCQNAFLNTWPTKKVSVLPHLINPFTDDIRFTDIKQDKINILSIVSQLTGRKGIDNIISAYYCMPRELTRNSRLIIKGTKGTVDFCRRMIIELNKPEIVAKEDYMTDKDMDRLLLSADVLFSPNRGEGYGIDIVRATYLGVDVVATNKGGYMDAISGYPNFFPIECEMDYAYCKSTYHDTDVNGLMWPNPNIKQCVDALSLCIKGAVHRKHDIPAANGRIEKHNDDVVKIFKDILEKI